MANERFDSSIGEHYSPTYIAGLSDKELADEINISTHTLTWSVTLDVVYIWCLLNVMRTYFFI